MQRPRDHRREQTQERLRLYRSGISPTTEEAPNKRGKKKVRFALDTKLGSIKATARPEDRLISPIAPPADTELNLFSTCIAVPDGGVFSQPNDFDERAPIRRLPSQMENGGG